MHDARTRSHNFTHILTYIYRLQPPLMYIVPPPPEPLGLTPSETRKVSSGEC